jgi:hypothetical protein
MSLSHRVDLLAQPGLEQAVEKVPGVVLVVVLGAATTVEEARWLFS